MTDALASSRHTGELLDGRYRLEGLIGAGGMSTVYRAIDETLGRTVAVKLFPPGTAEPADAARTASETRVLASLNHHALVTLFDANVASADGAYLVMEYVSGPTLAQHIDGSPMPSADVAAMALDLAEALDVVHEARIVHRDIKPSNVLLRPAPTSSPEFRAKLADFGIAYLIDSARITTPGLVVGTVSYLSPEQVKGAAPATPADVYALGLVLLEALTGSRAYPQPDRQEALFARLNEPPDVPGSLGYEWKSLLTAMTSLNPDDRPSAREVAAAVRGMDTSAAEADVTSAMTVSTSAHQPDAPPADETTVPLEQPEARIEPAPANDEESTMEALSPKSDATTHAQDARTRRLPPWRWILAAFLVLIVAAVIAGMVLWPMIQPGGTAPAPDLPALPAPLSTHLEQLMQEVTP